MAKQPKKPKSTEEKKDIRPTGVEYKLPFSSVIANQIMEYSPHGFFLVLFDKEGEPVFVERAVDGIVARAIENCLQEKVEELRVIREIDIESRIFGADEEQ